MSVSHVSHDEPTRVDVWTVLKELPQRIQALLKRHDASQELGFEELEHELHALFTHAECAVLFVTLFRSGFLGLFLIGRGSISHIVPPLSESRCGADWGRRPPW